MFFLYIMQVRGCPAILCDSKITFLVESCYLVALKDLIIDFQGSICSHNQISMWIQCCDKSDFFLCLEFMKCLSNLIFFSSHAFITGELASIQYRLIEYGDGVPQVDVDNSGAIDSFLAATVHLTELQNSLTKMLAEATTRPQSDQDYDSNNENPFRLKGYSTGWIASRLKRSKLMFENREEEDYWGNAGLYLLGS
ncbi:hypothetical protein POTOM_058741 [Populus tomentosa]|uniref:Uncharacterized protein n=1 Tax=Populus tomentosa TaxID=118781 RepID=A0A8X7XNH5_POPTO|nr:hypothetical protein POTOM_058741 [Populus tomentosa]